VSEPVLERATVDEEDVGPPVLDEGFDDDEQCDADLEATPFYLPAAYGSTSARVRLTRGGPSLTLVFTAGTDWDLRHA
jgi:hypothetical protein